MPRLPLESLWGSANEAADLRGRVADILAASLNPPVEIEITPEMIDAGEETIWGVVGDADLGGFFSARDLAISVFRAMATVAQASDLGPKKRVPDRAHSRRG